MKRAAMAISLLVVFLLGSWQTVYADSPPPPEYWIPVDMQDTSLRTNAMTLPFGIVYFGFEDPFSNDTPDVVRRLHERRHYERMQEMGVISFYASYFFVPGWGCAEEIRASRFDARYATVCGH